MPHYTFDLPSAGAQAFESPHYTTRHDAFNMAAELLYQYFGWERNDLMMQWDPADENVFTIIPKAHKGAGAPVLGYIIWNE